MAKFGIDLKTGAVSTRNDFIVGIDLGTTNSLIAYINSEQAAIIPVGHEGNGLLPSIIHISEENNFIVGQKAKSFLDSDPGQTVYSIKRFMGKTAEDLKKQHGNTPSYPIEMNPSTGLLQVPISGIVYTPEELSSFILMELKAEAEFLLKQKIEKAVITVPAYFSDNQRQATRRAGELAGLEVLRIINEPTAASLAYGIGIKRDEHKTVMVYDLGGGTFDVSVLRIDDGVFEVLSTNGDNFLGGDDIDEAIVQYWIKSESLSNKLERHKLRLLAEKAKIDLSQNDMWTHNEGEFHLSLNVSELDLLASSVIDRTIICCQTALRDCNLQFSDLDEILLVGGSSRLALVKRTLGKHFRKPLNDYLNPDQVVALGAAIQADILAGNRKDLLLLDVTPLSMGIETVGGLMDTIIPRNSKIPLRLAKMYTTSKDGQKNIRITVFQGERELVKDNIKLAEFILSNLDPLPAGLPKLEVVFSIDVDGILTVKAKELKSQKEQQIEIRSAFNLQQEVILEKLKDSVSKAQEDQEKRALIDSLNEGQYVLLNASRFLKQNDMYLSESEKNIICTKIGFLEAALQKSEKEVIHHAIEDFNQATAEIAHRLMDIHIQESLKGNSVNEM